MAFEPDDQAAAPSSRFVPDDAPLGPVSSAKGKPNPANAGVANFVASALGLPVDTVTNVLNLGIAGAGAATGTTPGLIRKPFGGSESIREGLRSTGLPGLSPDNPDPQSGAGTLAYNMAARGGFIPGGVLPAAGSIIAEKIGGPEWAGVGAMAPSAATLAWNKARAPSLAAAQERNSVVDETFREARKEGFVAPPSHVNPSFTGNRMESIAGKSAIGQSASLNNQERMNAIARREVGLPPDTPITVQKLDMRRDVLAQPYRDISSISNVAKSALERLKEARKDAKDYWKKYDTQGDPRDRKEAAKLDSQAEMLERVLEHEAKRVGKPELIPELRQARVEIAKTYTVERALNLGSGDVSARIIGNALDRGTPLSGGLKTAAKFDQAFRPFTQDRAITGTPGVSALEPTAMAGLGVGGVGSGVGWWPMGLPLIRGPVREGLLSNLVQDRLLQNKYSPSVLPESQLQMLLRQGILSNQEAQR